MIEPIYYTHIFDQQLYKINDENQLVAVPTKTLETIDTKSEETDNIVKQLEDKFNKEIWFFVRPENNQSISAVEYDMIVKTQAALKLDMNDIVIFVAEELLHSYFEKLDLAGKKIVDFGVSPATMLSEKKPLNEIVNLREGNYLFTATLQQLQNNLELKKDWWKKMKVMFE